MDIGHFGQFRVGLILERAGLSDEAISVFADKTSGR